MKTDWRTKLGLVVSCTSLMFGVVVLAPTVAGAASAPLADRPGTGVRSVDLRPVFANWGLEPRRQGARGTCSAFAVVGALEYALASQERHGSRLSVEFLNWASGGRFMPIAWLTGNCPTRSRPWCARASCPNGISPTKTASR